MIMSGRDARGPNEHETRHFGVGVTPRAVARTQQ
jgi:hypothetical protein